MKNVKLLDEDGENLSVRAFLSLYGVVDGNTVSIRRMKDHLQESGFDNCWPAWAETGVHTLKKGDAQNWIRYLFSLEATKNTWDDSSKNEKVDEVPPNWPFAVPVNYRNNGETSFGPITMASIESLNKGAVKPLSDPLPSEYSLDN